MNKQKFKEIVHPALVLTIICLVVTLLLAITNYFTNQVVNPALDKAEVQVLMGLETDDFSLESTASENAYVVNDSAEKNIGYVILSSGKGYKGDISIMTGFEDDGTIIGIMVLESAETPGIGSKIEDESFLNQYKNKKSVDEFKVVKNKTTNDDEIQGISGATYSTNGINEAINNAMNEYLSIKEG